MTARPAAPQPTAAEQAVIARFEAAEYPPEVAAIRDAAHGIGALPAGWYPHIAKAGSTGADGEWEIKSLRRTA